MKKFTIVFLLAFVSFFTNAQSNSKISFGVKLGALTSHYDISSPIINSLNFVQIGCQVGVFTEIRLIEKCFLQLELLYSKKNNAFLNLNYIEFPVFFKYKIKDKYGFSFGPSLSYLLGISYNKSDFDKLENIGSFGFRENKIDFGLNLDFSTTLFKSFDVGIRGYYGLLNIISYDLSDESLKLLGESKNNNKNLVLYLGFRILK